jgi:hypothetical protein
MPGEPQVERSKPRTGGQGFFVGERGRYLGGSRPGFRRNV